MACRRSSVRARSAPRRRSPALVGWASSTWRRSSLFPAAQPLRDCSALPRSRRIRSGGTRWTHSTSLNDRLLRGSTEKKPRRTPSPHAGQGRRGAVDTWAVPGGHQARLRRAIACQASPSASSPVPVNQIRGSTNQARLAQLNRPAQAKARGYRRSASGRRRAAAFVIA